MNTYQDKVQLKQSSVLREMTVNSVGEKKTGARGTVRFNGQTLVVVYDGSKWNQV